MRSEQCRVQLNLAGSKDLISAFLILLIAEDKKEESILSTGQPERCVFGRAVACVLLCCTFDQMHARTQAQHIHTYTYVLCMVWCAVAAR